MRSLRIAVVATLVAVFGAIAAPALASITGTVSFECTASLPDWPSQQSSGFCRDFGTTTNPSVLVSARAAVDLAGVDDAGSPFSVAGVGPFEAVFNYSQACIAGEPPLLGSANGTATVEGLTAVVNGSVQRARLVANFSWSRVGAAAVFTITGSTVFFDGSTASGSIGQGEAVFVPLNAGFCPVGGRVLAFVAGEATFGL